MEICVPPAVPGTENPRCVCGAPMKKTYTRPAILKLNGMEAPERLKKVGLECSKKQSVGKRRLVDEPPQRRY